MRSRLPLTALLAEVLALALNGPDSIAKADKPPANATSADVEPIATNGGGGVLHRLTLRKCRKGRILHRAQVFPSIRSLLAGLRRWFLVELTSLAGGGPALLSDCERFPRSR
jgi:hypothetical protein